MHAFNSLLGNQPDVLPSSAARTALLSAVGRHEDRLVGLRRQVEGVIWRGEVEADEELQAAVYGLEAALAAATRSLVAELAELTAACEDGLASAAASAALSKDDGVDTLEVPLARAPCIPRETQA